MTAYIKPIIWHWEGDETAITGNQPTSGARFTQDLPVGDAPYQVYSLATPNGIKVTIMLEELAELGISGVDYDLFKIDFSKGQQFSSGFVAINPNSKIPAMVDRSREDLAIFESAHILFYLAEKYNAFLPESLRERAETLNWLFWQTGAAPFVGGGFGHFFHYAPIAQKYPIDRYTMETKRQLDVLDKHLAKSPYMAGDTYTIADIAIWSWYGRLLTDDIYPGAAAFLSATDYPNLMSWAKRISDRRAVKRALEVPYQPF